MFSDTLWLPQTSRVREGSKLTVDVPAPDGTRPSAGTILSVKLGKSSIKPLCVSKIFVLFRLIRWLHSKWLTRLQEMSRPFTWLFCRSPKGHNVQRFFDRHFGRTFTSAKWSITLFALDVLIYHLLRAWKQKIYRQSYHLSSLRWCR